jgi:hypothetical protein
MALVAVGSGAAGGVSASAVVMRSVALVPMTLRVVRAHVLVAEARRIARERGAERQHLRAGEGEQQDEAAQTGMVTHDDSV